MQYLKGEKIRICGLEEALSPKQACVCNSQIRKLQVRKS
jgi:hypothetical protein